MISIHHKGDFKKTIKFLNAITDIPIKNILEKYGQMGVAALSAATPVDTGKTAASWTYEIEITKSSYVITWLNTNVNKHVNIALILHPFAYCVNRFTVYTKSMGRYRCCQYIVPIDKQ